MQKIDVTRLIIAVLVVGGWVVSVVTNNALAAGTLGAVAGGIVKDYFDDDQDNKKASA